MRRWVVGSAVVLGMLHGAGCGGESRVTGGEAGTGATAGRAGTASFASGGSGGVGRGGKTASGGRGGKGTPAGRGGSGGTLARGGSGGTTATGGEAGATPNAAGSDAAGGEGGATEAAITADLTRDITFTDLSVDLSDLSATARITLAPSSSTGASFEVGDLTIVSVEQAGTKLPWIERGAQLDVAVPASSEPLTLTVVYHFQLHSKLQGFTPQLYTFIWPYYCGNLFPCHSDPADGTRFALDIAHGPTTLVYPRSIDFDAPSYMLAWISRFYTQADLGTTDAGTHVSVRYESFTQAENDALAGTQHLVAAFDWFEKTLGAYQFGSNVGPVSAPWHGGGMEHHPFWHIADDSMTDELAQVHEAAHGWFGNGVRLACWEDFVLSEGTVSYLAARALDEVGATSVAATAWSNYETTVAQSAGTAVNPWPQGCGHADILTDGQYGMPNGDFTAYTYAAGALFFRALEQKLGRPALDAALHEFYTARKGTAAHFQDLLDTVQISSGYDPSACANHWLRDTVPPTVTACE